MRMPHCCAPSSSIFFDDPNKPKKFDALIEALGAKSIEYETKMLCCGGNLNTADEPEEASALARMKLIEITKSADALALHALRALCNTIHASTSFKKVVRN